MAGKKIGLVLALDGEKEFTQAVQNAKKEAKLFETQMKGLAQEFEGNANSMDYLRQKQDLLSKQQEAYQRKLDAAKAGLDNANNKFREQSQRLEELRAKLKEAKQAQEKMEESGEHGTEAYEKQTQAVEELEKAVEKQVTNQMRASGRITEWNTRVCESETDLRRTNAALEQNERYLKEAENAADHCARSIDEFGQEVEESGNEAEKASDNVNSFGDILKANLASEAIISGIEKIAEGIKTAATYAMDVGMSFEAGMSEVAAISGATGSDLDALTEKAKEMGAATKFSATEAADAFKYMAMAGWDSQQMLAGIEGIMNLAAASGEELGATSDIVTDALSAFGMAAGEAGYFSDILAMASSKSNTNVAMMGETFKYAAPVAGALGYSAEDTAIAIGMMANSGIKASQAGTALRKILTSTTNGVELTGTAFASAGEKTGKFAIETVNADGSMRNLNDIIADLRTGFSKLSESEQAANAEMIAGKVGMSGLLAIMNETDENYQKLTDSIYNCAGATSQMADTMQDNLKGKITILQSALEGLGISAYEKFSLPMQEGVEDATGAIEHLTKQMNSGELGHAMEELSEALADSADEAVRLGADALQSVSNGLVWIVKHKNEITAAFKGITSGLIMHKAVTTVTAVVEGVIKLRKALVAAKTAQEAFNLAQLANPYALVAAGIAGVGAAMVSWVKSLKKADSEADKYAETVLNMAEETENAKAKIEESKTTFDDTKRSVTAESESLRSLTDRLYELEAIENKSNSQKLLMKAYIEQLNEALPGLNLKLDEQTGKLNKNCDAVREYINSMGEKALYDAYESRFSEVAEQIANAEMVITQAMIGREDAERKIKELEAEKNRIREESISMTGEEIAKIEELDRQQGVYRDTIENSNKIIGEQEEIVEGCNTEHSKLSKELEETEKRLGFVSEAAGETADSEEELAFSAENVAASADAQKEALQSLHEKFEEIKASIQQSMESKISLFDVFDGGEKEDLDSMLANLDSQMQGLTNWKDNMAALAEEIGDSMTAELYDKLVEMGPDSANIVQEMVNALDNGANESELKKVAERYAELLDLTDEVSENMAGTHYVIKQALGEISESSDIDFQNLKDSLTDAVAAAAENGQVITKEMEDAFLQTVEAAKRIGAEIPDGLAESLVSGEVTVEDAISQLKGSMEAQFGYLSDLAENAGISIPEDIRNGIAQGGEAAAQAMTDLVNLLMGETQKAEEDFEKTGKENAKASGEGMESAKKEVAEKTGGVMREAVSAAKEYNDSFKDVGYNMMSGVAIGLNSGSGLVYNKVRQIMKQAKTEADKANDSHSPSRVWRNQVGAYMAQGLALGISDGKQDVIDASVDLADASLKATKEELEIHSPSGAFKKQVGERISEGVALGIKIKKAKSKKAAKEMAKEVAQAAEESIENYRKNNVNKINTTLDDEEYMWKQLVKKAKKGGKTYQKEIKKLANEHLKEIKQQRKAERLATQESLLSNYKEYYELSPKAEMDYWNIARKQFKEGTDQRLEADQKYFAAKEEYYSQLSELEEEYYEKCTEINDKLADDIEKLEESYKQAFEERKSSIKSAFGTFDEFTSEAASPETLLANMQSQTAGYALWIEQLQELSGKGILKDAFMEELRQMGPEATATIMSLNMMTEEQLKLAQEAWDEKDRLAEAQAAKETESLRQQKEEEIKVLKETAQAELNTLKEEYTKAYEEINTAIEEPLKKLLKNSMNLGESAVAEMIKGLKGKVKSKETTQDLKGIQEQVAKGLDGLPEAGKDIGKDTLANLLDGLSDKLEIKKGAKSFAKQLEKAIKKELGTDTLQSAIEKSNSNIQNQQTALSDYLAAINGNYGVTMLNNLAAQAVTQTNVTVNNTGATDMMSGIVAEIRGLKEAIWSMGIYIDEDNLVGCISEKMGNELAGAARKVR